MWTQIFAVAKGIQDFTVTVMLCLDHIYIYNYVEVRTLYLSKKIQSVL